MEMAFFPQSLDASLGGVDSMEPGDAGESRYAQTVGITYKTNPYPLYRGRAGQRRNREGQQHLRWLIADVSSECPNTDDFPIPTCHSMQRLFRAIRWEAVDVHVGGLGVVVVGAGRRG